MKDVSPHRHKMRELDGLRGLASLLVVLAHIVDKPVTSLSAYNFGGAGVMLFFVLSGFLMGHLYLTEPHTLPAVRKFAVARIARIVPIYYCVVIASFLLTPMLGPAFSYNIDFVHFMRLLTFNGSRAVFWSVGPEFQFYAFFVLVWLIASLQGRIRHLAITGLLAFVAVAYAFSPHIPGVIFLSKLHIFMIGVGVALLRRSTFERVIDRPMLIGILQILSIPCVAVLLLEEQHMLLPLFPWAEVKDHFAWYYLDLPRSLLAAVAVFAFSFSTRPSAALLANPPLRQLGMISFSLYLLHLPVINLFRALGLFEAWGRWPAALVVTTVAIAVSVVSNRLIENPARKAINDRWASG